MKPFYLLAFILFSHLAGAQEFPFFLYYDSEPYAEFDDGLNATFGSWDDPNAVIPIGFDFDFFGTITDTWIMSSDFLGGTLFTEPSEEGPFSVFMVYGSDLVDIGYPEENISTITYKTTGSEPNRIFHMQWADCGFYPEVVGMGTAANQVNFQIRLFENTGDMEIHFGPHSIKNSDLVHDGPPGPPCLFLPEFDPNAYSFGTIWILGGPTTNPEVNAYGEEDLESYYNLTLLEGNPSNGTLYRFTTTPLSVFESEVKEPTLFPNPVNDILQVTLPAQSHDMTYEITNLAGQRVDSGLLNPGDQKLDTSFLEAGVYLMRLQQGDDTHIKRFVKSGS